MWISKVKLDNIGCFYDSPAVELGRGLNFVIGKNNAGKTTFIDALSLAGTWSLHRSRATIPTRDGLPQSDVKRGAAFEYAPTEREINRFVSTNMESFEENIGYTYSQIEKDRMRELLAEGLRLHLEYDMSWDRPSVRQNMLFEIQWDSLQFPSLIHVAELLVERLQVRTEIASGLVSMASSLRFAQSESITKQIFKFNAERRVPATGTKSANPVLASDTSNLPDVLQWILGQGTFVWGKYLAAVKQVLPDIEDLRLVPVDNTRATITVDYCQPSSRRTDLGIPLDECGTGVGQVLAMVCVAMFYDEYSPRIILIDEPNSFLHPDAIRKLIAIFQKRDHHQYIIATHSPIAIMSVQEKHILLVTRENMVSSVNSVNTRCNTELENVLEKIGSRRSDIFGMDAYIWVEGKTDKTCFSLIMGHHGGLPAGVEIVDLVHTGDFSDKKRGALIEQIYARLSGSVGILPSVLAFVFDGDLQNDSFKETDTRKFLPRQNYESYLIVPNILADMLNRDAADGKPKDHTADSVTQWIRDKEGKEYDDPEWLKSVDGAKLLNTMFQDLAGISYKGNKAQYGEEITRRILANEPNHFQEIVDLIKSILPDDAT